MAKYSIGLLFISLLFITCKKEKDSFSSESINDYYPLQVGKYITYDLDSTVFVNFGQKDTTVHYQAQDRVDAEITDNLGRPAYRVIRYLRKDTSEDWVPNNTFLVVPTENSIEYVENNLRFIKLKLPVTQDYTWKGNSFINTTSDTAIFDFRYLANWDYAYDSVDAPLTLGAITLDSTVKVAQRDDVVGNPGDPNSYTEINYGVEYYAKGIGMVYKRILHSEYQPPANNRAGYYSDNTKGATFTMIDHN